MASSPASALLREPAEPTLGHLAGELRIVLGQLIRRLREQSPPGDLSWPQFSVLGRLEREGPATVTELARAERIRSQSMGATIASLEEAGMVHGSAHPTDGRQTILNLTQRGRDVVEASRMAREDWLSRAIETTLEVDERRQLEAMVPLLRRLIAAH